MSEKLNVELELCGHKGRITRIWGGIAQPPWHPKDSLSVYIEFAEPHPEGIAAMAISIPAKEYYERELLAMIKKEGEKQVAEAINKQIKQRTICNLRQQREETLNALAEKAEKALG